MSEDIYCALCGVPFDVDANLYRAGSVTEDQVEWSQYFVACKVLCAVLEGHGYLIPRQVREDKYEEPCDWYLSGIGRYDSSLDGTMLPPTESSYDARKLEDWPSEHDCDAALPYACAGDRFQMYVPSSDGILNIR